MRQPPRHHAMILSSILVISAVVARLAAEDTPSATPSVIATSTELRDGENGVVLLQDGGLLAGQITRAADWYVIERGSGQMQIAVPRVVFVGRTMHEAYAYRSQHATQATAEAHLGLAEWCLRYDLVDEASIELQTAKSLGAGQGRLAHMDRRLSATKERLTKKTTPAPVAVMPASDAEQSMLRPEISRDLPDGVLEMFTRKVQPILVNNCTASKCHQPGGQQSFQLNRALLRGEANRRTTVQNLTATLALVDRTHPELSPLLTVPRQTHGGMNGPIFGARQAQAFKHLADWVAIVAPSKSTQLTVADTQERPVPKTLRGGRRPTTNLQIGFNQPAAIEKPIVPVDSIPDDDAGVQPAAAVEPEPFTLRSPHRLQHGVTGERWQPRDPFDPEIFNRRQQTNSQAPEASGPAPIKP
jgi:hypothetical protein